MAERKLSIADAFISWHAAEIKASKDGKNPHFRSTYSTLEEVIAACRKAGQHGLTFTQLIDMDDMVACLSRLLLCMSMVIIW